MTTLPIARSHHSGLWTGVACGMGAGALWGLVFLAPELVGEFSPLQIAIGRYLSYGLIAAALLAPRWRSIVAHIPRRQWWNLMWLAFAGNTLYYIFLANAVQIGGIAMTSLVIGFLPVVVTIVGSREDGAVALRKLAPSLLLCVMGAICIGWQAVAGPSSGSPAQKLTGLLCAIAALALWSAYAIGNARCLAKLDRVSSHDWSLLTGVVTGAQSLILIPFALAFNKADHSVNAWLLFGAVSVGIAVLASIAGNGLWNRASRLLPLTLVGQMILFETLFALLYGFMWERRLPTWLEIAALVCVVLSVMTCLAAHRKPVPMEPAA